MTATAMVAEFGDVASWTTDAVEQLGGPECETSGPPRRSSPAALAWLAEGCESRRVQQVAALVAARHGTDPAFALAARQGSRFARLFADGQISMRLIHAVSRQAGPYTAQPPRRGATIMPTDESQLLRKLEADVETELDMARSSPPEEALGMSPAEWLLDPADAEREEVGLRTLLGAVQALEGGSQPDHTTPSPWPATSATATAKPLP